MFCPLWTFSSSNRRQSLPPSWPISSTKRRPFTASTICPRLKDPPAVALRLGRRDQVKHQLLRTTVAAQLQGGGAVVIVEQQAGVQLEADGVVFPLQGLVDTLADIVIVIGNQPRRILRGDGQQGQPLDH